MTAYPIPNPFSQWVDTTGLPMTGAYIYIGEPNQDPETHPIAVYQDADLTIGLSQPIRTSGGYIAGTGTPVSAYPSSTPYSLRVRRKQGGSPGAEVFFQAVVHNEIAEFFELISSPTGATKIGYTPRGWNAPSTVKTVLDNTVIAQLVDGLTTNQTSAIDNAVAALGSNGGYIEIPAGTFLVNATIAQSNIVLRGQGGRGEFNQACLNPFSLAEPTLTFGDDVGSYYYNGIENLHVSGSAAGTDGSAWAAQAPQAMLLKGGILKFHAQNFVLYGGKQTLSLTPGSPTAGPITKAYFSNGEIRNDVTGNAGARGMYMIRKGSNAAYLTGLRFVAVDLNMAPGNLGYAGEFDGTALGFIPEFFGCYWDVQPGLGVLLKGSANLTGWDLTLDPGTTGVVVIEADQAVDDISRFITGLIRIDQQKFKFSGGVVETVPVFANFFGYRERQYSPFLGDFGFLTSKTDPFNTAVGWDATGPSEVVWTGRPHYFPEVRSVRYRDTNGAQVVTTRQPSIAHATDAASAITQLNLVIDMVRTHGLIG